MLSSAFCRLEKRLQPLLRPGMLELTQLLQAHVARQKMAKVGEMPHSFLQLFTLQHDPKPLPLPLPAALALSARATMT